MLKLVLPKGSLEKATMELFADADLQVNRSSSVDYKASVDDPRIDEVRILRPQEIPQYVEQGLFDESIELFSAFVKEYPRHKDAVSAAERYAPLHRVRVHGLRSRHAHDVRLPAHGAADPIRPCR